MKTEFKVRYILFYENLTLLNAFISSKLGFLIIASLLENDRAFLTL